MIAANGRELCQQYKARPACTSSLAILYAVGHIVFPKMFNELFQNTVCSVINTLIVCLMISNTSMHIITNLKISSNAFLTLKK